MSPQRQKEEVKIVQMPVYLPEDMHKAIRIASIEEGRSATDIIRELVKEWLEKRAKQRKRRD